MANSQQLSHVIVTTSNHKQNAKEKNMYRNAFGLDIQNLVSNGNFSEADSQMLRKLLEINCGLKSQDQIFVATGPGTLFEAKLAFPDGEVKIGRGQNGADYKLKEHLSGLAEKALSFGTIFVGTGDHELLPEVEQIRDAGGSVVLVGVQNSIHNPYYHLGIPVLELPPLETLKTADWTLTA
jgi:hypothetical protein